MLNNRTTNRPDRQLEKTLISLVYAVVAIALSLLMLFIYPEYSLYLIALTFITTILCIVLAMRVLTASEKALTYGGFANEILESRDIIRRIDNNIGQPIIENKPAAKFFAGSGVMEYLRRSMVDERQNLMNFQRLELAIKSLKKELVLLSLKNENELNGEPNSSENWYQISIRPLYLKKSDIFEEEFSIEKIEKETYFLWTLENVTANQNVEKIFAEERKKLHNFIHYLPVGIYVADSSHKLEYINETFAAQIGEARENLIGQSLTSLLGQKSKLLNPRLPDFCGMTVFHNQNGDHTELFVMQNNIKEGSEIKIRGLTLKELPNDSQLLKQINYAADQIDWLVDSSPAGIIFCDDKGIIERVSRKAAEILETSEDGLIHKNLQNYLTTPTLKLLQDLCQKYLNEPLNNEINKIETRLKNEKIIRIAVAPRRLSHSKNNAFEGLILYLSDTTEQKNLELKFAQAQKMQAMGQLAGGVAHDFNNLLTAMIGFCDLLLQRHGIGDPSFADLIQIKQNANRAAGLVRQLLAFSRKQPLKPKRIDVTENFIELSHLLRRILGEQIVLEFNHGSDLGYIRVDPVQFSQVIINLAVNAKDAMNGKGRLKITTRTETLSEPFQFGADTIPPGDFVVISVSDNGCGIAKDNLNRIFEPFFSTKQNVVGSGTGLGLAMVYGIVRQTEGFIRVDSTVGSGTTFSIHLPRFERSGEENEQLEGTSGQKAPETSTNNTMPLMTSMPNQSSKIIFGLNVSTLDRNRESSQNPQDIRILFVEDEDSVRAFAVRALKKKGFAVTACNCAENAIELLESGGQFNLLITDMVMPGLSGAELAKVVKQKLPQIKIILASGYSEEIARHELAGSEEFEFIAKPYSLGDLTKKVYDVLNGK